MQLYRKPLCKLTLVSLKWRKIFFDTDNKLEFNKVFRVNRINRFGKMYVREKERERQRDRETERQRD